MRHDCSRPSGTGYNVTCISHRRSGGYWQLPLRGISSQDFNLYLFESSPDLIFRSFLKYLLFPNSSLFFILRVLANLMVVITTNTGRQTWAIQVSLPKRPD